ncbi:SLBB domain-containing protein [Candidatus Calescamantes bacterium]|nr:SLBB domain-containing protein [Candidatus Calescamantes bacterium]MCK5598031.1 SLBB domain-containing protein [bacterium]
MRKIRFILVLFTMIFIVTECPLAEGLELTHEDKLIIQVNILGQVGVPGVYKVEYGTTIIEALTRAGGLNDYADMKNILIVRYPEGKKQIIEVNLKKFFKKDDKTDLPELMDGDIIMVNKNIRKGWTSFVTFISQLAIILNVFYLISKDI